MRRPKLKKKLTELSISKDGKLIPLYSYSMYDSKGRLVGQDINIRMLDRVLLKHFIIVEEINQGQEG